MELHSQTRITPYLIHDPRSSITWFNSAGVADRNRADRQAFTEDCLRGSCRTKSGKRLMSSAIESRVESLTELQNGFVKRFVSRVRNEI